MRTGIALVDGIKCRLPFFLIFLLFSLQDISLFSQESRRNPNSDNIILLPGKKFIYKQVISELEKDTIFYFVLSVEPEPLFNETLIKYTYFFNEDSVNNNVSHFWEQTLATENRKWYALHPPRGLVNEVHQLLPFPEIKLLKGYGHKWKEALVGMKGWDNFPKNTVVKSKYQIMSDTVLVFKEQEFICKRVESESFSKLGEGKSVYYFNPKLGFMLFENKFNNKTILITLTDVQ